MSVAAAPCASTLCRLAVAGRTTRQKRCGGGGGDGGASRVEWSTSTPAPPPPPRQTGNSLSYPSSSLYPWGGKRGGACCARRRGAVVTSAHVGDAEWLLQQGVVAGVILGGFIASGGMGQISSNDGEGTERRNDGLEDPNETCPMCEGTGKTACACVRWSDDEEGCSSCGYTGIRNCPACRGGGRAVRVTVEIPVEQDNDVSVGRGGDRSSFAPTGTKTKTKTTKTAGSLNMYAFANPLVMPRPAGLRGDSSSPSSSSSLPPFRFPSSLDDDEFSGRRELDQDALMRLLGQMPLISGGKQMLLSSSFVDGDVENTDMFREDGILRGPKDERPDRAHGVIAEPPSNNSSSGGGGGSGGAKENKNGGADPSSSKDDEFYAQSGEAIRTLRDDYPFLLQKPLVLSIYREDIGLIDETGSFGHCPGHVVASGIGEYERCHKWLRAAARILFCFSEVRVQRIWSPLGSNGVRTIKVRWSITARLRLVGNIAEEAHFDGISEYRLDRAGFIYQHTLTDLDWDVAQMRDRIAALSTVLASRKRPQLGSGQWFKGLVPEGWFK